ncbi:MAG: transposase [Clostridia bacterium]|nr:transposase [Clostridia bacterium]
MPRSIRKISKTKVYHVILRGIDKQDIFVEEQDYNKFIKEIQKTKEKYKYELYAYCLMSNHIHMIIYDKNEQLSKIIQSLAISYSLYFNKKYERSGHLFQNRFLSKSVEDRKYLVQVCRYIHQNPFKAKISKTDEYRWSSYKEYIEKSNITDTEFILSMFSNNLKTALENFIAFHNIEDENRGIKDIIEYEMIEKLTDYQVKQYIEETLGIDNVTEIKRLDIDIRNEKIKNLKNIKGTSMAQISRVIGINRKIVERVMKNKDRKE